VSTQADSAQFVIWGGDRSAYSPVELPRLAGRIRADNKRLRDSVNFSNAAGI
jgi:hypothetical protein